MASETKNKKEDDLDGSFGSVRKKSPCRGVKFFYGWGQWEGFLYGAGGAREKDRFETGTAGLWGGGNSFDEGAFVPSNRGCRHRNCSLEAVGERYGVVTTIFMARAKVANLWADCKPRQTPTGGVLGK